MIIIVIAILVVCVLLGLIVLIQNPKGGGLESGIGTIGTNIAGAKSSTETVEKWTWYLASALIVLSLASSKFLDNQISLPEPAATETPVEGAPAQQPATPAEGTPAQQPATPPAQ